MSSRQSSIFTYFSTQRRTNSSAMSDAPDSPRSTNETATCSESLSQTSSDQTLDSASADTTTTRCNRKRPCRTRKSLIDKNCSFGSQNITSERVFSLTEVDKENVDESQSLNDSIQSVESLDKSLRCNERVITDFDHFSYEFLQPDKLRDDQMRSKDDYNYDPSTLHVPAQFLQEQSPAMKIWWKFKTKHFDTLLFFKMGRFYELYHMDAVIAVRELDIAFMRGTVAHCGFPEPVGSKFISCLVRKNYKVARIEQIETPDEMNARIAKQPRGCKDDKIVLRQLCEIVTPGTLNCRVDEDISASDSSNFMFCLSASESIVSFAACNSFDCELVIGSIERCKHELQTLFTRCPPRHEGVEHTVTVRGSIIFVGSYIGLISGHMRSNKGQEYITGNVGCGWLHQHDIELELLIHTITILLDRNCGSLVSELQSLIPGDAFIETIPTEKIKTARSLLTASSISPMILNGQLPDALARVASLSDHQTLEPKDGQNSDLVIEALGCLVWYLRECRIDRAILSKRIVSRYNDAYSRSVDQLMDLDGCSLRSLGVVSFGQNSLEKMLDFCITKPGKRLLRKMLISPSRCVRVIRSRYGVINALCDASSKLTALQAKLRKVDDIEHGLKSIHVMSSNSTTLNDANVQAIMSDEESLSKSRVMLFAKTVQGLDTCIEVVKLGSNCLLNAREIGACQFIKNVENILNNDPHKVISQFQKCIKYSDVDVERNTPNRSKNIRCSQVSSSQRPCIILPIEEQLNEYNDIVNSIEVIKAELESYRRQQCKILGHEDVTYVESGRNRYHFEIPSSRCKQLPECYKLTQQKRSTNRYITESVEKLIKDLSVKESQLDSFRCKYTRDIFANATLWNAITQCVAMFDYFQSMATWKGRLPVCCEPVFNEDNLKEENMQIDIQIDDGIHPFFLDDSDFIPNSISLDSKKPLLLTGPNMGGKSTILRQLGLATIMAQVGIHIPAKSVRMSLCDRILTRIGSYDKPQRGQSTFHVEVSEMKHILNSATAQSLVLVDEFGRGTSIEEGQALSKAVINYIMKHVQCRIIFSTHFHALLDDSILCEKVNLSYMDFLKESDNKITFLYKLVQGYCTDSHGLAVARMANLPDDVVSAAESKSTEIERNLNSFRLFRKLCECTSMDSLMQTLKIQRNIERSETQLKAQSN